ncbi:hypothetical protein D3C75_47510 [compost metagenome]
MGQWLVVGNQFLLKGRVALQFHQHAQLEHLVEQWIRFRWHLLAEISCSNAFEDAELVVLEIGFHVEPQAFQCTEVAEVRVVNVAFGEVAQTSTQSGRTASVDVDVGYTIVLRLVGEVALSFRWGVSRHGTVPVITG